MPLPVEPEERVSRFLRKQDFSVEKKAVRPGGVAPMRGNISGEERWETSVFQSSGLDEEQIRELALKYVVPYRKQLRARADWLVAQVMSVGLGVVEDPPPPLHAVIIGWSSQIEQWMQTQVDLCAEAELTLYNEPIE